MCGCHSILECCVLFSGVKFSIRSFVLFHSICMACHGTTGDLSVDFQGAFLSKMFQIIKNVIRTSLQN